MEDRSLFIFIAVFIAIIIVLSRWLIQKQNKRQHRLYHNVYLKSNIWKRKRRAVLRRDRWRCVYCGARATHVDQKRHTRYRTAKEPLKWLVSVCDSCSHTHYA